MGQASAAIPLTCVAIALLRRAPAWDPASLWLDDLWIALAVKHRDLTQMLALKAPSPLGFLALERLAAGVSNDLEWPLQIVPALAGLLAIPLFYLALRKLVTHPGVLALATLLAACHPVAELYSMRVKHYSLDLLVVTALLWLMLHALQKRALAGFAWLVLASLLATSLSFASLFVSLCFVHALVADQLLRALALRSSETGLAQSVASSEADAGPASRCDRSVLGFVLGGLLFDLAVLVLHRELLADQSGATMKWFWRNYFLHFDSVSTVLLWIGRRLLAFPMYAFSAPLLLLVPLLFVGARALARDPGLRPLVWACGALVLGLIAAAALDIYPMGAERTGLFSYPLFWALAAVGGERWWRDRPVADGGGRAAVRRSLGPALAAYVVLFCVLRPAVSYSDARDRQVVEEAERRHQPGDGWLMQHTGLLAFAYYGGAPLRFERYEDVCHRFAAWPVVADLTVLPIAVDGVMLRDDPTVMDPQLSRLFEHGYQRIFYVSTHANDDLDRHIVQDAEAHAYRSSRTDESPQARLFVFESR